MVSENLAYEYIDGIPWGKNPAFAFSNKDVNSNNYKFIFHDIPK